MPTIPGHEPTDQVDKGPPRETEKKAEFAYKDWGSFLADAAAEGKWQIIRKHLPQAKTHAVILEDIMDEILVLGSWHWRDKSGKLVMSGIKERVMRLRGEKYKQARDDKRAAEGRPLK